MSVNSCSINSSAVNSICSGRRNVIIQNLLGTVVLSTILTGFPIEVDAGHQVNGQLTFTNNGPGIAIQNNFILTVPIGLSLTPILGNLPAGVTYSYNGVTGQILLIGMPDALQPGQSLGPITISYTQPTSGSIVTASMSSFTTNTNPGLASATVTIHAAGVIPPPQTGGHHPQHVNPNTRENLNIFRRDRDEDENVVETHTLELPQIAVTVTMAGQEFTHTIDRGDEGFVPMINVYNVKVKAGKVEESVNISDISIRIL